MFILQRKKLSSLAAAALVACATAVSAAPASAATSIHGAGSTLVAPIEASWATAFQAKTGITVNYDAVGSGTGITEIISRIVDFGASDAPMTSSQFSACGGCTMIPWGLSATGVGYHLSGVHKLQLSGSVIAKIYLGQITRWNDPAIAKLNKGRHLPNVAITPVYRTDGSGDTYAFTNFLSKVNGTFRSRIGRGTQVSFPRGVGGKGNSGVTAQLESVNGSIAYIAVSYLIARRLPAVKVENAAGNFEYPNLKNIINAASTVHGVPSNNIVDITNPSRRAKIAYPISTFTYAIVPNNAASAVKQFVKFAISSAGQSFAEGLDFAPLPSAVASAAARAVNAIH